MGWEVVGAPTEDEFFVFGESGLWGKYAANGYRVDKEYPPLDIYGFRPEYEDLFFNPFKDYPIPEEKVITKSWLPPAYQKWNKHL